MSEHDSYRPSQADMDARRLAICPRIAELRQATGRIDREAEHSFYRLSPGEQQRVLVGLPR